MIKTASHIIFSALFLILTVGVSINKHYSNGKLYSQSFFGEAETCDTGINEVCEMQNMPAECEMHNIVEKNKQKKDLCSCEDTTEYLHFDANFTIPEKLIIKNVDNNETNIISMYLVSFYNSFLSGDYILIVKTDKSLLKIPDFTSLLQVFRC